MEIGSIPISSLVSLKAVSFIDSPISFLPPGKEIWLLWVPSYSFLWIKQKKRDLFLGYISNNVLAIFGFLFLKSSSISLLYGASSLCASFPGRGCFRFSIIFSIKIISFLINET